MVVTTLLCQNTSVYHGSYHTVPSKSFSLPFLSLLISLVYPGIYLHPDAPLFTLVDGIDDDDDDGICQTASSRSAGSGGDRTH